MRHKVFVFALSVMGWGLCSGCSTFFVETPTAYEVGAGSVKSDVDVSYDRAYDASLETIREIGGMSGDKKSEGWIKTQLHHHYVAVYVEKLTDKTARVTVSARRYAVPQPQYAQEVLAKILKRIQQQPLWLH